MRLDQLSLEDIYFLLKAPTEYIKQQRPDLLQHLQQVRAEFEIVYKQPDQYIYEYVDWSDAEMLGWGDHMSDIKSMMYKEWVVRR